MLFRDVAIVFNIFYLGRGKPLPRPHPRNHYDINECLLFTRNLLITFEKVVQIWREQQRQLVLSMYPDCIKNIKEVNERVYAVLHTHWNTLYPDCLKIMQDVNERVLTVPGTYWNTRYPDSVRNIHSVNGRGYTLPGTHWNALRHCFQLVPGIFMLAPKPTRVRFR